MIITHFIGEHIHLLVPKGANKQKSVRGKDEEKMNKADTMKNLLAL